jgi:predicted DsbA family dithiol-disulfide isomerase
MTGAPAVEVFFDFICPWCLIGRRNLETALSAYSRSAPAGAASVVWRPHVLLPYTPEAGEPFDVFYLRRLGSRAAVAARQAQVREAGRAAGIEFDFGRLHTLPNTFAAHHLVDHAARTDGPEVADGLIERLFAGHFLEGGDIGERSFLARTAVAAGLDPHAWDAESRAALGEARAARWRKEARKARVNGVPFYVFHGKLALSGAHPPETLLDVLMKAEAA